ncbi:MAG: cobalamin-dependent protein [Sandaracinaceae bacterium]|nr:cobalamin-dependent protein [Sandaracinaceae bacterium]
MISNERRLRFVYPRFSRHADVHPELREHVPCNEYFGGPSLGIAYVAAMTPPEWTIEFRDDRVDDVGLDDPPDVVGISCFTPSGKRAMELADAFRARGSKVVMGGIFPTMRPDECAAHCDAVVEGEAELLWPRVLSDAAESRLAPRYRATENIDPAKLPLPRVDLYVSRENDRYCPDDYPVQLSRGCMLKCSACAIPGVLGRSLRPLPVEHGLAQIEQLERHGKLACLTEDTSFFPGSAQQRAFGELLDRIAERGTKMSISYVGISMPLVLAQSPAFFARLRRAGVSMFYLVGGFDPITRGAFTGTDPKSRQRAIDALRRCMDEGVEPYTSFLVGNDDDDEGTFDRMLEVADAVKLKKAEFAIRTPYPGTPDFTMMRESGRLLHEDWSRYNDANVVFQPTKMSPARLERGYVELWRDFYRSRRSLAAESHRERTIQF